LGGGEEVAVNTTSFTEGYMDVDARHGRGVRFFENKKTC